MPAEITSPSHDYNPYTYRIIEFPLTNFEAFVSIVKCSLGTGLLAMPMAFANAGYIVGIFGCYFVGAILVTAMNILLINMYKLCKLNEVPTMTYAEAMRAALELGPSFLSKFSNISGHFINVFLAGFHFAVCCVYVIFVAENLKIVLDYYVGIIDYRIYICILTIPLMAVFQIRSIKQLVPLSITANLLILIAVFFIMFYIFQHFPPIDHSVKVGEIRKLPLFFGSVLFAIESVGLIIATEANMKNPEDFLGFFGILNIGLFLVITLYAAFGFFGYWRFGIDTAGIITMNLLQSTLFDQITTIAYAIGIFLTYALQGYVTITIIGERYLFQLVEDTSVEVVEVLLRIIMVLSTVLSAALLPHFSLILPLVGSMSISLLGLVFPAIVDMCVRYNTGYGDYRQYLVQDIALVSFGLIGGISGTYESIQAILTKDEFPPI